MDFKQRKSLNRSRYIDKNTPFTQQVLSYGLSKSKHKSLLKTSNKIKHSNLESKAQKNIDAFEMDDKDAERFLRAKAYYKQFKLTEAYRQFENISRIYPNHEECLYLLGVTCINLEKPTDAIKNFQKLLRVNPDYKQNVYLLTAISYNRVKQIPKAMEILTKALAKFENFYEAYCFRAKILISMNKFSKAEEDYDKAILINPKKSVVLIGKADCLRARGADKQAISYYNKALQQAFNRAVLLKRASLFYQTKQFQKCLDDITLLMQQPSSEVLYYRGLLYLNYENEEAKAIISFQSAIKMSKNQGVEKLCIIQLLKLRINSCDFYQCTNIIQMAKIYNIQQISPWENFVEAVISLMKKKHHEADKSFDLLQKDLNASCQQFQYLNPLNKIYRGYCYFCLFQFQKAYEYYVDYKTYTSTVLGRILQDDKVNYNTDLFEALMLSESGCLEDSLQKLNEMLDKNKNFELSFYKLMVIMKIAISDDPFLGQMDSKQQILLWVLELMPDIPEASNSPCLLYYEALLKSYFQLYSEAEKSINKSIEKAEENLGRLFHLRAIINCQLGNFQQSINDLSICMNIEEKAIYYRDRARMYQLIGEAEQAYEDLQKYIQVQTEEQQISKWASILLFANRAYEESSRALNKIEDVNSYRELKQVKQYIALFEGRFEDSGIEGKVLQQCIQCKDQIGLDKLINTKSSIGYFPPQFTYFFRIVKNYCQNNYSAALKDLQLLLFTFGTQQNRVNLVIEIKYSIMVCHLLNNDFEKAKIQFRALVEIPSVIEKIQQSISKNLSQQFDDLSQYFQYPHMSQYIPSKTIPGLNIKLKLSIPFPEPSAPNLEIKVTSRFLHQKIKVEAVDGKAEAPWIRKNNKGKYQFTNQLASQQISMLSSQNNSMMM